MLFSFRTSLAFPDYTEAMPHSSPPLFTLERISSFPFPASFPCVLWPPLPTKHPTREPELPLHHPEPHPEPQHYHRTPGTASSPKPPQHDTSLRVSSLTFSQLHHQLPPGNCCLQQFSPHLWLTLHGCSTWRAGPRQEQPHHAEPEVPACPMGPQKRGVRLGAPRIALPRARSPERGL